MRGTIVLLGTIRLSCQIVFLAHESCRALQAEGFDPISAGRATGALLQYAKTITTSTGTECIQICPDSSSVQEHEQGPK